MNLRTEQNGLFQLEHIRFIVSIQIHIHEYGHVGKKKKKQKRKIEKERRKRKKKKKKKSGSSAYMLKGVILDAHCLIINVR